MYVCMLKGKVEFCHSDFDIYTHILIVRLSKDRIRMPTNNILVTYGALQVLYCIFYIV